MAHISKSLNEIVLRLVCLHSDNILFQVNNYLDHVASFSTYKEMHAFVPMMLKSFKLKYSKAPEVLLDLGTPRHQIYRRC